MKKTRIAFFYWLQIIFFLLILARLVEIQLIKGEKNRILAEENRVKRVVLPAGRGIIYDRHGLPLVENIPLYRLEEKGEEEPEYLIIDRQQALEIQAEGGEEAAKLKIDIGRRYLYRESLAHFLGYIGQVSRQEVEFPPSGINYQPGDLVGRGGVEEEYDSFLRGKEGVDIFETDALNKRVRTIGKIDPQAGQDLYLAIDARLSKVAFEALEGRPGAVVATEARTGKIISLVSSPSYDPNQLSSGISLSEYQDILENPQKPFFNRPLGGAYPPGSTFKIVTAVAGLEEGKINGSTLINDPGVIKVGDFSYRNWYFSQYGRTEGEINIVRAIKRSTDTFFYQLGERLGAFSLADWAKNFGLGQETGVDLPGEITGLVPDPDWKEATKGERWFLGNTYHFSIGQADLTATPLQVNMMTSVIANQGRLCQPEIKKDQESQCRDLKLEKETLQLIKEGMGEACSTGGTAFPLFDFRLPAGDSGLDQEIDSYQVACKTGTAEFGDSQDRTHAWLTAFAPVDDPIIVVTALVEAGGEGSEVAGPIVRKVLEAWFNPQK